MSNLIKKNKWLFEYNRFPGEFVFSFDDIEILKSSGTELGILTEKYGYEEKCRLHYSAKNESYRAETETKHPFGPEPVVKHRYEQNSNHFRITTDIQIKDTLPLEYILADNICIPGKWEKITAYTIDCDEEFPRINKHIYKTEDNSEIVFKTLPLIVVFENTSGFLLEVGCGHDLWRWNIRKNFNADSEFTITKTEVGFDFKRKIVKWDEEYNMPGRNFRFCWYFSWNDSKEIKKYKSVEESNFSKLIYKNNKLIQENKTQNSFKFYIDAKTFPSKMLKNTNSEICYCSNIFNNQFKRWLRSFCNTIVVKKAAIELCCLKPGLCVETSHVPGRDIKKQLHFDYLHLMGLYDWADKYLSETDFSLSFFIAEDSPFKELPSAAGLINSKF
ncbi:MAG: hypothetical protein K9M56_08840 [Victivallales bacterium]|nr:hypothetical protein [Victivallales bacterium]